MFRRSTTQLAAKMNAFAIFSRHAWKLPRVQQARGFRAKSRIVHAAWARLSPAAKRKFAAIGKRTPVPKKRAAPIGAWQKFVKKNYKSVRKLPFKKRLAALSKRWEA